VHRAAREASKAASLLFVGGVAAFLLLPGIALADSVPACDSCHTGGRTLPIYGLHDAHSHRLASQIASAMAGSAVTLDPESAEDLADLIADRLQGVSVTASESLPVSLNTSTSISVDGTLPVAVESIGDLDRPALLAAAAVGFFGLGALAYSAVRS